MVIGPDHYLYAVIGDLNHRGKLQNIIDEPDPDDTSVIFRVRPNDGSAASDNPFINDPNVETRKYYAYGIRNSFGIAFDPVTGNLWQTENGPDVYDEINVVKPGFNSEWIKLMGPLSRNAGVNIDEELANYSGSHYADPVFSWKNPIAVTDIEFINRIVTKMGVLSIPITCTTIGDVMKALPAILGNATTAAGGNETNSTQGMMTSAMQNMSQGELQHLKDVVFCSPANEKMMRSMMK